MPALVARAARGAARGQVVVVAVLSHGTVVQSWPVVRRLRGVVHQAVEGDPLAGPGLVRLAPVGLGFVDQGDLVHGDVGLHDGRAGLPAAVANFVGVGGCEGGPGVVGVDGVAAGVQVGGGRGRVNGRLVAGGLVARVY